jgi:hypothetical protein
VGDDAVIKLYRPGFLGHRAEAVALAELDGRGIAPKLLDTMEYDGRTGLVLERLGGSDAHRAPVAAGRSATGHAPGIPRVDHGRSFGVRPSLRAGVP